MILNFEFSRNVEELEFDLAMPAEILVNKVFEETWIMVAHTAEIAAEIICIPDDSGWTDRCKKCDCYRER